MEQIFEFIILLAILFFIPKLLTRLSFPQPFSELLLGIILGPTIFAFFTLDPLIELMGTIGIITLFFIAGFEVDIPSIRKKKSIHMQHAVLHVVLIAVVTTIMGFITDFTFIETILITIALLTPSAGFVIAALKSLHLHKYLVSWIEAKVVSMEVFSLLMLLIIMKIDEPVSMIGAILLLGLVIIILPNTLRFFYNHFITKGHADTFLIFVMTLAVAFLTHELGVHYIIGAFIVGLVVSTIEIKGKDTTVNHKKIWNTFGTFTAIFAPFYFFSVGLRINQSFFELQTIGLACLLFIGIGSIRIMTTFGHRRTTIKERPQSSLMVAVLTSPTLLFTFIMADILLLEFGISNAAYNILIMYGLLSAILPMVAYHIKLYTEEQFAS
jgi:Kef-type K+ transport system membrane component KefB